jgi:hypothetical protein
MIPHKPFDGAAGTCALPINGNKNKSPNKRPFSFFILVVFKF